MHDLNSSQEANNCPGKGIIVLIMLTYWMNENKWPQVDTKNTFDASDD